LQTTNTEEKRFNPAFIVIIPKATKDNEIFCKKQETGQHELLKPEKTV
jgi:hypothetical protein